MFLLLYLSRFNYRYLDCQISSIKIFFIELRLFLNMPFTDKQMFDAIEANADVKLCFERISIACKELKSKTGCPNDDVDRFLEFAVGKWADSSSKF